VGTNRSASIRILLGIFILVSSLVLGVSKNVIAQTEEVEWAEPVNLSQSGSTDSPVMVIDNEGTIHAVWLDVFDGQVYSKRVEGEWTSPKSVKVPWAAPEGINALQTTNQYVPTLIADSAGKIHAFWIGEEQVLYYSSALVERFADNGWTSKQLLGESIVGFEATIDILNGLHISYVRSLDTDAKPAGVYYQAKKPRNPLFGTPALLFESNYFREVESGDIKVSVLVITGNEDGQTIFISWDNRPRKELFLIRSGDGGTTWDTINRIAGPDSNTDTVTPNGVGMVAVEDKVLLIWKEMALEIPSNCRQYSQVFSITGQAEGPLVPMLRELPGCPLDNQTLISKGGLTLLQTTIFNDTYLLAWDGSKWSEPQIQPDLSNLIDPETFQPVLLKCVQVVFDGVDQLFLIGCDSGTGGDIWFTSRTQGEVQDWFSRPPVWSSPTSIISSAGEISSVSVVADNANLLHAVWAQSASAGGDKTIYYARWNGREWTHILSILEPPFGKVNHLATTIDAEGRLFLVWSGGEVGEIYFSWANANLAGNPSEWTAPLALPMPRSIGNAPDIVVAESGDIFVTYAVPLNEQRGIYLIQSTDGGRTWTDPIQVLDGAASGWEIIDQPSLGSTSDGNLHILFLRYPPPNGIAPKTLYYSYSEDNGKNWSTPEEVIGAEVTWSAVGGISEETAYRIWQEESKDVVDILLETSTDGGSSWSAPINFAELESRHAVPDVVLDNTGSLHLLQLSEKTTNELALQEWIWDGTRWNQGERQKLGPGSLTDTNSLAANLTSNGRLGVLITKFVGNDLADGMELVFLERMLEEVETITPTITPTVQQEPELEPETTPTPTMTSTPTQTPQVEEIGSTGPRGGSSSGSSNSIVYGVVAGFLSAGLVVLGTFIIFNRLLRRDL
jgi:hypothetical protein